MKISKLTDTDLGRFQKYVCMNLKVAGGHQTGLLNDNWYKEENINLKQQ